MLDQVLLGLAVGCTGFSRLGLGIGLVWTLASLLLASIENTIFDLTVGCLGVSYR